MNAQPQKFSIDGTVELLSFRKGKAPELKVIKNAIMNVGMAVAAGLLIDVDSQVAFTHVAIGDSSAAVAATQTALQGTEHDRQAGSKSRVTTTVTNDTAQLVATFNFGGATTVEELGVFNDPTTGTMLNRLLTGTQSYISGESLQATVKFQIKQGA